MADRPQPSTFEGAVESCYAVKSELREKGGGRFKILIHERSGWREQEGAEGNLSQRKRSVNRISDACFDMLFSLRDKKLNKQSHLLTCILGMICSHPLIQLRGNIGQLSVCI